LLTSTSTFFFPFTKTKYSYDVTQFSQKHRSPHSKMKSTRPKLTSPFRINTPKIVSRAPIHVYLGCLLNPKIKMKLFAVLLVTCLGLVFARPEEKYTIKYDNIDLQEILQSDRLTENYVNCLLDKKPCTPDGTELKRKF
jgi:hypothetical protein